MKARALFGWDFWICAVILMGNLVLAIRAGDWNYGVTVLFAAVYMRAWYINGVNYRQQVERERIKHEQL